MTRPFQISLFLFTVVFLSAHPLTAQRSFGFKGGMTISNFSNPEQLGLEKNSSKKDYTFGYLVEFEIKKRGYESTNLVFQSGMTLERRGLLSTGFDERVGEQVNRNMTMKYFTFPMMLKGGLDKNAVFNLMIGPEFSLLYLATDKLDYTTVDPKTTEVSDRSELIGVTRDFKGVDVSITAGFSIDIPIGKNLRIPIDVRAGKSLMDTRKNPSRFNDSSSLVVYKFNTGLVLYH